MRFKRGCEYILKSVGRIHVQLFGVLRLSIQPASHSPSIPSLLLVILRMAYLGKPGASLRHDSSSTTVYPRNDDSPDMGGQGDLNDSRDAPNANNFTQHYKAESIDAPLPLPRQGYARGADPERVSFAPPKSVKAPVAAVTARPPSGVELTIFAFWLKVYG